MPKTESLPDQVVWMYRSYTTGSLFHDCKEYTFSADSKTLFNRRHYACH